jgi:hypothetical protein
VVTAQAQLAKVGIKSAPPTFVDVPVDRSASGDAPPHAARAPGSVHGAAAAGRVARGPEHEGEADGGEVDEQFSVVSDQVGKLASQASRWRTGRI